MANLRDIRNRISSVNNTIQITKAMKMVAAAKLRKAQNRMSETRPYASKLDEITTRIAGSANSENPLLRQPESAERIRLIVVGSDRGLCGAFNNNLFKIVEKRLKGEFSDYVQSDKIDLICIGKKAEAYFKKRKYPVLESYPGFFDRLDYAEAIKIMSGGMDAFIDQSADAVYLAYNEFKSVITQNRIVKQVLPIDLNKLGGKTGNDIDVAEDYIFEPNADRILDQLLPLRLNIQLWSAALESNAAEQGARMAAMDNATENAKELEEELRLKYNQARQSAITTEISEIVSGAQALEDS